MSRRDGAPDGVVIHVLTSLHFGGVEKHMEILARSAFLSVYDHRFCAIGEGGHVAANLASIPVRVTCLGLSCKIPNPRALYQLWRMFKREGPLIVHTHGAEANFHALIAAWFAKVPVRVGEEIGIPRHGRRARWVFKQVFRCAHRVVGISNAVVNWLVVHDEVPSEKAVRIYNPVEFPPHMPGQSNHRDGRFRLGYVGRLESVKNPEALIRATGILRDRGIPAEAWLVGDGSLASSLTELANDLEIAEHIHFLGYQESPFAKISMCHLYVQPSISEGFGLALVEAMGCAVPVLATSVGGAPEIITHDRTGWLIEKTDASAVAAELQRIWANRAVLPDIGQAGRDAVLSRFLPENYVRDLDHFYSALSHESLDQ
ncbi:glycosyltransferase [Salinisphaera sp. C84B14]|uniref:glycosyltransferase n=1 Tax=Salinisphaera sp. C84B14 TaxID=1304155 RepID=UPI00333EA3BD